MAALCLVLLWWALPWPGQAEIRPEGAFQRATGRAGALLNDSAHVLFVHPARLMALPEVSTFAFWHEMMSAKESEQSPGQKTPRDPFDISEPEEGSSRFNPPPYYMGQSSYSQGSHQAMGTFSQALALRWRKDALAIGYAHLPHLPGNNTLPSTSGEPWGDSQLWRMAYARELFYGALGFALGGRHSDGRSRYTLDLSLAGEPFPFVRWGLVVRDLPLYIHGYNEHYDNDSEYSVPAFFQRWEGIYGTDLAVNLPFWHLSLAMAWHYDAGAERWSGFAGMTWQFAERLSLLAGLARSQPAGGLVWRWRQLHCFYGFELLDLAKGPVQHSLSIAWSW